MLFYFKKKPKLTIADELGPTLVTIETVTIPPNNTIIIPANDDEFPEVDGNKQYQDLFEEAEDDAFYNAVHDREKLIAEAKKHVDEAHAARLLAKDACYRAQESWKEYQNKTITESELIRTVVIDYGQNANLPHTGSNQCGDAYYLSPLRVYNLGIVNCCVKGGRLHIYPYHEGMGGKGMLIFILVYEAFILFLSHYFYFFYRWR